MRKSYPATKTGLRRLGRDMQAELEKNMKPVNVPVRYQYAADSSGVTASPWAGAAPTINNHYGDVVSIGGDHNVIAVGNQGPVHQTVDQTDNQWRMELLAALGNIQSRLDDLDLDDDDRDSIEDAAASAAAIASEHGEDDEDEVDDTALRRRGRKVLQILEKVATSASGGVLAQELAGPLQQLLS